MSLADNCQPKIIKIPRRKTNATKKTDLIISEPRCVDNLLGRLAGLGEIMKSYVG